MLVHCLLVALLSCSCYGLQKLIDMCYDYGVQRDIKCNPQKSQAATFGGNSPPVSVKLGDAAALGWVSNVKYLGCYFLSRSCEVDTTTLCPEKSEPPKDFAIP